MLNVSKLLASKPGAARAEQTRPVIVWNTTRLCNLACAHCYSSSGGGSYGDELTTDEGLGLIESLAGFEVPALVFSGGDPLLRGDIFKLMSFCKEKSISPILSTSGINISPDTAKKIKDSGVSYVGISIDGSETTNDLLRGHRGAFKRALIGIRSCMNLDLNVGLRFTMTRETVSDLPFIFGLIEEEGIGRGYFSHMVYSGRAGSLAKGALTHEETRRSVGYIFKRANDFFLKGVKTEIVTGSNDSDGVYFYLTLQGSDPDKARLVHLALLSRGGNPSGTGIGGIDSTGEVHPDQFWTEHSLGNIRDTSFPDIWTNEDDPLLMALRHRKGLIKGRCSRCSHFDICNGNCRQRAEFSTGDPFAEDPACYLTDSEIGIFGRRPA
ncbi:MAG: radical SAM protein [Deltaproteobacteria bacterium]|nr:radical SAM protein [Deltaproteobacteria bacterium]